eukprot:gene50987-21831_t
MDWCANMGSNSAYLSLTPYSAGVTWKAPILEIPPAHKAILMVSCSPPSARAHVHQEPALA